MGTHPIFESDFDCLTEIVKMTSDGSSGEYSSDEEYSEDMTEDSEDFSDDTSDLSDDEELTEESIISSEESIVEIKQKKSKKKEKIDETKKSKKSESKPEPKKSQKSSNKSNPKSSQKPVKTALQNGHQSKSKRSSSKEKSRKISIQDDEPFKWGFTLNQVYRTAVRFYKDKEGRAFNLAYNDKVMLAALTKQVAYGPINKCKKLPEIGYFDWFGNDRQKAWTELGSMKKNHAMEELIHLVDKSIPVFSPFMIAQQKEEEEKERIRREEEERKRLEEQRKREEEERKKREEEEARRREEEEKQRKEEEERQKLENSKEEEKRKIMAGLNAQTAAQFQQYAAQQHPGDPEAQAELIAHLQDEHYAQYMAQLSMRENEDEPVPAPQIPLSDREIKIEPPSMWTRPQIRELKDQLQKDTESVLTVGRGEVVTVRVPTHEEGAYLFWEFATDSYDLGFGVYFEWSDVKTNQVSIAVNESSDEEYYPESEEDDEGHTQHGDAENGHRRSNRPPTDEIVPVYRRDCHQQVHAGSHQYPGSGVYLLKFDNSYSLWRSKTLYYRVYYTR